MARFILIDNWLENVGGHNYQYAMEILQTAKDSRFEPILATAKTFAKEISAVPATWSCYPIFRYAWNRNHTVGVDGKRTEPINIEGQSLCEFHSDRWQQLKKKNRWLRMLQTWDRKRRIEAFKSACQDLFEQIGFDQDDDVT